MEVIPVKVVGLLIRMLWRRNVNGKYIINNRTSLAVLLHLLSRSSGDHIFL